MVSKLICDGKVFVDIYYKTDFDYISYIFMPCFSIDYSGYKRLNFLSDMCLTDILFRVSLTYWFFWGLNA